MNALILDNNNQEVVSREKKDRLQFDRISALATAMGLFRYVHLLKK